MTTKNIFLFFLWFIFSPILFTQEIKAQVSNRNLPLFDYCREEVIKVAREIKSYGIREVRIDVNESHTRIKNEIELNSGRSISFVIIPYPNNKSYHVAENIMSSRVLIRNWMYRIHKSCYIGYYSIGRDRTGDILNFAMDQDRNFFYFDCVEDRRQLKNPVSTIIKMYEEYYCAYVPFK